MNSKSIIHKLPKIVKEGRKIAEEIINRPLDNTYFQREKIIPGGKEESINSGSFDGWINKFYYGDNLKVIESLLKEGYGGKIDLIYIDPPFLTKANYKGKIVLKKGKEEEVIEYFAYRDVWEEGLITYLKMLYVRIFLMRELLSHKGTIYVHLDYRTVNYVKILMDEIFGEENFLNEIIWAYKSGGVSHKYYSRKHDNILVYTKGKDYIFNPQLEKSYNRGLKPYRFKGVKEYKDEIGWYTLVNLKDVWQIDMVGRTSKERIGYDTQKPIKLLERIILTSSNEDSIVADFYAGSGTTGITAEMHKRKWIMADKGALSYTTINNRLMENQSSPYYIYKDPSNSKRAGKLNIKNIEIVKNEKGREELYIELGGYQLDIEKINIRERYRPKIEEVLNRNSLSLIDFIGIDMDYDGNNPLIHWQDYKDKDNMTIHPIIRLEIGNTDNRKIYIKYIDVFGQENSITYEVNDGRLGLYEY